MVRSLLLFSQEDKIIPDSLLQKNDSIIADTIKGVKRISPDAVDKEITYNATGLIRNDLISRKAFLVREAYVKYGDIEIKADSIVFSMASSTVFAVGIKDSTGKVTGKPKFKSGDQEFESDTLKYNFKTKEAYIRNIMTKQEEGLLRSSATKLMDDGTSNIFRSTYSTCELDTPHFYIFLKKAKVYPGKKIISGPGNLVLEGIPLPLYIPFGFFPIQTKKAESGIIIPKPHYESGRGYALTDGGYYFALSSYFDLTLQGNIFTNGSWMASASTNYNRLYRYNGRFSFSYANNVSGHKGLEDYRESRNYSVAWNYNQSAKARPGSRFSASVNMSSAGFDRNNSYNLTDHVTTTRQSSISYSKTWEGTPFNLSVSANHSQNVKTKKIALNLPKMSFSMARIYPLKRRNSTGPSKWWQELQFQYSASLDNQIDTYDSLLFTNKVWNNMRSGFTHEIPMSLQIRPFKNFSISPSLTYKGVLYTQKIEKTWMPYYRNPETNKIVPSAINDTTRGFFYGQAINPSISAGFSPQIFGIFQFTNPNARLQAIRHVMKPSVSFSYVPSFKGFSSKMFRQVQIDTLGRTRDYSIFEGGIYGTPSSSSRNGNISFNLTNILEAKVFERNDTSGKPKKINIIDNFGMTTGYNVFADSLNWSPLSMVMATTLLGKINISARSSFSFYGLDKNGRQIGTFYYSQTKKLMRFNEFNVSLNFSVNDLFKSKDQNKKAAAAQAPGPAGINQQNDQSDALPGIGQDGGGVSTFDEFGYMKFDAPWTMNISYAISYSKPAFTSYVSQTLSLNGSLQLTKKMNITYNTGYDFKSKQITMTQIHITRDLHCWDMSFDWVPNGYYKMWTFTIKVKAAVLADLKYERRKDYHDNY
jgi:hypothetical protein